MSCRGRLGDHMAWKLSMKPWMIAAQQDSRASREDERMCPKASLVSLSHRYVKKRVRQHRDAEYIKSWSSTVVDTTVYVG